MQKSKILLLGLLAGAVLALPNVTRAATTSRGIEGSMHDLSTNYWNTRKGVCSPCHAAHNTDPNQTAPLWTHATTVAGFTPYNSPTFNAGPHQPDGVSLACLSCHDGTVAVNQLISGVMGTNGQAPVFMDPSATIGTDLHTTHPISFIYDGALAAADGTIENPTSYHIGDPKDATRVTVNVAPVPASGWSGTSLTGKSIAEAMLFADAAGNKKMQCASCHDVHKQEGSAPESGIFIRISGNDSTGRGSLICRTCHIK